MSDYSDLLGNLKMPGRRTSRATEPTSSSSGGGMTTKQYREGLQGSTVRDYQELAILGAFIFALCRYGALSPLFIAVAVVRCSTFSLFGFFSANL